VTNYSPYFAEELGATDIKFFMPIAIKGNLLRDAEGQAADRIVAYRTTGEFWGKERTVVVTHNPATARKKGYTLERKLETLREALLEFRKNYREARTHWRNPDMIYERYERLCERLHIGSQYYRIEFRDRRRAPDMSFRKDDYQILKSAALHGRNIIITDNHDWSTEEIVQLALDRYGIEQQFRNSKSPRHVSMNPFFHWTDSKIRCQILTCVIALTALRLFELDLEHANVQNNSGDHSACTIIEEMQALSSVITWHKAAAKPIIKIEHPTPLQQQTLAALGYKIERGSVLQLI
jgi:transposase